MNGKKGIIADTVHGNIELTSFERKIMSHVTFNRLHDVYQNSTVYLTFPCNRTKRFEHSIGTMKLCCDIFKNAIKNSDDIVVGLFLEEFEIKLTDILKKIKGEKYNEYSRKLGGRVKKVKEKLPDTTDVGLKSIGYLNKVSDKYSTYLILLQAVRIAALLHDIGHPPYSHITEFALGEVRENYKNSSATRRIVEFNKIMNDFFEDDEKKLHEQMGDRIVDIILSDSIYDMSQSKADSNNNHKEFENQVFQILVKETVACILGNEPLFESLHRIVDGTLDGDRLDYVTRDALNSGLNKGKIEYDRLCNGVIISKKGEQYLFCPDIKTLNTVEDYLNRRWDVYKNIIFHHRVIKTDYLLQNVIKQISIAYLEEQIDGENLDTNSDLLPADISGLWKALKKLTNVDSSYAISQWDDSWLMTVLKKHYFHDFINNDEILSRQLSELLTNKKYYFSVIKRLEDFLIVDTAIAKELTIHKRDIIEQIEKLRSLSSRYGETDEKLKTVTIDPFLKELENTLELSEKIDEKQVFQGLIFSHLKRYYLDNSKYEFLQKAIDEAVRCFPDQSIEDVFFVVKKYDVGLKKPLFLYNSSENKAVSIHDISSISKILNLSYDTFPQFFIYILKTEKFQDQVLDIRLFLEKIGEKIADQFYHEWISKLNENIALYHEVK